MLAWFQRFLAHQRRLRRIRAIRGAFKNDLPSTWQLMAEKQAEIDREDRGWRPSE